MKKMMRGIVTGLLALSLVVMMPVSVLAAPSDAEEKEVQSYTEFQQSVVDQINETKDGSLLFIDGSGWMSFDSSVIEALEGRDIDLVIRFSYEGYNFVTGIPEEWDEAELLDENGYCGFLYLSEVFGANIVGAVEAE